MTKQNRIKSLNEALKILAQSNITKFAVFYKRDGIDGKVQVYIEDDLECELIQKALVINPRFTGHYEKLENGFALSDAVTLDYLLGQVEELYKEA